MKIVKAYVRSRRSFFGLALGWALLWMLIFFLYSLEWEAYGYGMALCGTFGLLVFGLDLARFIQEHHRFQQVEQLADPLNASLSQLSQDAILNEMLSKIEQEKNALVAANEQEQQLMLDYFTLWVHQVKLPIAALKLLFENDPTQIGAMKEQVGQIDRYTGMVLAFLRMRSSASDFVFEKVDLDPIIQRSIRSFSSSFIYQKIPLEFEETHLRVLSDAKWLGFAIDQILSNAIKYSNGKKIEIYHRGSDLVIEDHGVGISLADQHRILEKGFTGKNGRYVMEESSGLGLYLTKEILHKLNHTIRIESKPEQGTRVILSLDHKDLKRE